jgi:hypothetical protein
MHDGSILNHERRKVDKQTLTFTFEKETKNTIRYQEQTDGKPPAIGSLYVQKWALGNPVPEILQVVVFGTPTVPEVTEAVEFAGGGLPSAPTPDSALSEPSAPLPKRAKG